MLTIIRSGWIKFVGPGTVIVRQSTKPKLSNSPDNTLIWQMYAAHIDMVKHFNGLQTTYRTFASAWILGAFTAMVSMQSIKSMVFWICIASLVGMAIFYSFDIAYHALLKTAFEQQKKMEEDNSWIPKTAIAMDQALGVTTIRFRIHCLYLGAIAIFGIIAYVVSSSSQT